MGKITVTKLSGNPSGGSDTGASPIPGQDRLTGKPGQVRLGGAEKAGPGRRSTLEGPADGTCHLGVDMLYVISFLCFFGAAITGLLLAVDATYSRSGVERRLAPANTRHWAPEEDLLETPVTGASALPPGLRQRLWLVVLLAVLLGVATLLFAL
jgi:hypothetical protein